MTVEHGVTSKVRAEYRKPKKLARRQRDAIKILRNHIGGIGGVGRELVEVEIVCKQHGIDTYRIVARHSGSDATYFFYLTIDRTTFHAEFSMGAREGDIQVD